MAIFNSAMNVLEGGTSIISIVCIFIIAWTIYSINSFAGTPPGPWGLPILGYLPFFSRKPYLDFVKLGQKYGDVFSVKIGSRYVIVVNDYETIKNTTMKDIYSGKPKDGISAELGEHKSIFVTDGPLYRDQRRFLMSSMRDFGFGKKKMEDYIFEEAELILEEFRKTKGQPLEINDLMYYSVTNIISCLLFGERFSYNDKEILKNVKMLSDAALMQSNFVILDAFPNLQYILPFGLERFKYMIKKVHVFIDMKIEEHKKTFNPNDMRDIIDSYLSKLEQTKSDGNSDKESIFGSSYLRANAMFLFAAGTETTASTLTWALKLLSLHTNIQSRVQKEIDDVIGRERPPRMSDKNKMVFTEATILEIERTLSHLPLTLHHRVTEDAVLRGYKIPKDSFIICNLWNVHNDPKIWKNPSSFIPDRFIDSDGKISNLKDYVIPFSIGKRSCLGESLARMEIFLFLTSFLQKFTFTLKGDRSLNTSFEVPVRKLKSCYLSIMPRK